MHKCFKCGQEFEGNFCPKCGNKYEESKTCPTCGETLDGSVNFCNNCGYRFDTTESKQTAKETKSAVSFEFGEQFYRITNKILKWSPCVLFLLFAVLNFVFMSLSAYSAFGMDMGSIYKLTDADYKFTATVLIVFCSLSAFYALVYPLLLGKRAKIAHIIAFVMYVLALAVSCAMHIQIKKGDWTVELATKLLIAFAVVFACLAAISIIADALLAKRSKRYADAKNIVRDSSQPTFTQKAAYHIKSWYASHKKAANGMIIGVCSVAVVCVLVFVVIIPFATNIFTERKLSKINIGYSKEQVISFIGEPYGGNTEANVWTYYGDEFIDLMKQQDEINKQMDNLSDFNQLGQLMEKQDKLDEKINKTVDKYINVEFNENETVKAVTYDAKYSRSNVSVEKEIKKATINKDNTIYESNITSNFSSIEVNITYTDGSYRAYSVPISSFTATNFGEIKNGSEFPSTVTLNWLDSWGGEYSKSTTVNLVALTKYWDYAGGTYWNYEEDTLSLLSTVPPKELLDFFNMDYPWIRESIKAIVIGENAEVNLLEITDLVPNFQGEIVIDGNRNYVEKVKGVISLQYNNYVIYVSPYADADEIYNATFGQADEESIYSNWYYNLDDGPIYVANMLVGYKGKMPDNYTLEVKEGTTVINMCGFFPNSRYITSSGVSCDYPQLKEIVIPSSVNYIAVNSFNNCFYLTNFRVAEGNLNYSDKNGILYNKDQTKLLSIPGSTENLLIDEHVNEIDTYAFVNCINFKSITVSEENNHFFSKDGVLYDKTDLNNMLIPNKIGGEITIADGVTVLYAYAFYNDSYLTSITIPDSVTSIGSSAFSHCSSLTTVYYTGTAEDWKKISIGSDNTELTSATRYYYSESEPADNGNYWHYVDGVATVWEKEA